MGIDLYQIDFVGLFWTLLNMDHWAAMSVDDWADMSI